MALRVDWRTSASLLGTILQGLTLPLGAMALLAAGYREPVGPWLVAFALPGGVGTALERLDRGSVGPREAFLLVAAAWFAVAVVGAVPFVLAGTGRLGNPVDALFESTSGITTSATILVSFDGHGRAIMRWRQVLQWLGGLGVLVLAVGLLSELSVSGAQLMETETRTGDVTKLTPRIERTARLLGGLYVGVTGLMVAVLLALCGVGSPRRSTSTPPSPTR